MCVCVFTRTLKKRRRVANDWELGVVFQGYSDILHHLRYDQRNPKATVAFFAMSSALLAFYVLHGQGLQGYLGRCIRHWHWDFLIVNDWA